MAVSFFDQNMGRAYPFVANDRSSIPDTLVVDFRAVILQGSFDPAVHRFFLAWLARFGNRVRLGFRTDCPDLADQELVFEVDPSSPKYSTLFTESSPSLETVEERCGCGDELLCNIDFGNQQTECGSNLLCQPDFNDPCGPQQVCNPRFQPDP